MRNESKKILIGILSCILAGELLFAVGVNMYKTEKEEAEASIAASIAASEEAAQATEAPTTASTTEPTEETTTEPTTEPEPQSFLLSFAGDCTLGSYPSAWYRTSGFVQSIGENYDFPFANVREYFENDEFTIINFEGTLTDSTTGAAQKTFAFRGPTEYVQIMSGSSVEAVTLANNHSMDYGKAGYESTLTTLTEAGIGYVEENKTTLYTTENGLIIGLYADAFDFSVDAINQNISELKEAGAELIICAFHWGKEGSYRRTSAQEKFAHAAIDAGADIVYGHHPHVLQVIEEYGDGIIYYSLGNFAFGGSVFPQDYDTALLQQEVIREPDGSVHLGELTIIPMSISSMNGQNNFQPTAEEEGSERYNRVLAKLDGSFTGSDLNVDYSKLNPSS